MRERVRFLTMVFLTYVVLFAMQKPFFLPYDSRMWLDLAPGDRLAAVASGLAFDMVLAAYLSVVPLALCCLSRWLRSGVEQAVLKGYFLLTSLGISGIFAQSGLLFDYPVLRLSVFVLYAAAMTGLFWERIVPLYSRRTAPFSRRGRSLPFIGMGLLLLLPVFCIVLSPRSDKRVYDAQHPGLYHLAVNPYYEIVTSLHDSAQR